VELDPHAGSAEAPVQRVDDRAPVVRIDAREADQAIGMGHHRVAHAALQLVLPVAP
jgi:hypothetical protein